MAVFPVPKQPMHCFRDAITEISLRQGLLQTGVDFEAHGYW